MHSAGLTGRDALGWQSGFMTDKFIGLESNTASRAGPTAPRPGAGSGALQSQTRGCSVFFGGRGAAAAAVNSGAAT